MVTRFKGHKRLLGLSCRVSVPVCFCLGMGTPAGSVWIVALVGDPSLLGFTHNVCRVWSAIG